MNMSRVGLATVVTACVAIALTRSAIGQQQVVPTAAQEWRTYGHDPGGMRFSALTQITPANVGQLTVAWVYHMKPPVSTPPPAAGSATPEPGRGRGRGRGTADFFAAETTPLVIDGVMYVSTPYGRVAALDPTTGKETWIFTIPSRGQPSTRGVEYWPGDSSLPPQIVFGTNDGRLISLHAKTGEPNEKFGDKGIVNLNTPEILQGSDGNNGLSSPPVVYRNLVITGGRYSGESPARPCR